MGRDQQILEAAAELFYERGFHAVGVDEIGARAGVTGPAIYRHFSGKDEILATLFNEALDQLLVRTEAAEGEPWAELELLIRAQTTFALNHRHVISIYTREGRALAEPWRRAWGAAHASTSISGSISSGAAIRAPERTSCAVAPSRRSA